jgi:hypothetical protein
MLRSMEGGGTHLLYPAIEFRERLCWPCAIWKNAEGTVRLGFFHEEWVGGGHHQHKEGGEEDSI